MRKTIDFQRERIVFNKARELAEGHLKTLAAMSMRNLQYPFLQYEQVAVDDRTVGILLIGTGKFASPDGAVSCSVLIDGLPARVAARLSGVRLGAGYRFALDDVSSPSEPRRIAAFVAEPGMLLQFTIGSSWAGKMPEHDVFVVVDGAGATPRQIDQKEFQRLLPMRERHVREKGALGHIDSLTSNGCCASRGERTMISVADTFQDLKNIEAACNVLISAGELETADPTTPGYIELFHSRWPNVIGRFAGWAESNLRHVPSAHDRVRRALQEAERAGNDGRPEVAGDLLALAGRELADGLSIPDFSEGEFVPVLQAQVWLRNAAVLLRGNVPGSWTPFWIDLPTALTVGATATDQDWVELAARTVQEYGATEVPTSDSLARVLVAMGPVDDAAPGKMALSWLLSRGRIEPHRACINAYLREFNEYHDSRRRDETTPVTLESLRETMENAPRFVLSTTAAQAGPG